MKQGIHQVMRVQFDGTELDLVSKIEFRFRQQFRTGTDPVRDVVYPGEDTARVEGQNAIDIDWTATDTAAFNCCAPVMLDTRITVNGSTIQPETAIVNFSIHDTLFEIETEPDTDESKI